MTSPSTLQTRALRCGLHSVILLAVTLSSVMVPDVSAQNRYILTIHNNSKFTVARLYVQNAERGDWGPDEMKSYVLGPGKSFKLTGIKPGEYNIKFVDAKGRDCVLRNYAIVKNLSWSLTTEWLQKCRSYS